MILVFLSPQGHRYTLQNRVNGGGFGEVYFAQREDGYEVALKFIKPGPSAQSRWNIWINECNLALKCLNHPHIVQIYESFQSEQGHLVIVMEKANCSLDDLLKKGYKFTAEAICALGTQILSALEYIHPQNIIHRDVTPKNILSFPGGTFKLADFGISKKVISSNELARTLIGWWPYRPPEHLLSQQMYSSPKSDLYQLGLVFLTLMTGQQPISPTLTQQQIDQQILAGVPRQKADALINAGGTVGELARIVSVMLRRRDNYRYASAAVVHAQLSNILARVRAAS